MLKLLFDQTATEIDSATEKRVDQAWERLEELLPLKKSGNLFYAPSKQVATDALYRYVYEEWGRGLGKNHFLTTAVEEATPIFAISHLDLWGGKGTLLPVDRSGRLTADGLQRGLTPRSSLLSLSLGNAILGTLHPIEELLPLLEERGVLLHLDLSHLIGKMEIDPSTLKADFITFSLEPRGGAILWSKRPLRSQDLIFGSEKNALGLLDIPNFLKMGEKAKELRDQLTSVQLEGALLREHFEHLLGEEVLFKDAIRLPLTSVVAFPGVKSEALLFYLQNRGLTASMGGGQHQMISHLLKASHFSPEIANSALSFSFTLKNSEQEIEEGVRIIKECYHQLKKVSGYP